ncbi:hypothetical protein [Nocardia sp. NPDC051570]|uniref:hypothetical protein n=1 Tax=Nocardia sp. NPDC051570 TaxID=3364324 RepID=UPI003799327C
MSDRDSPGLDRITGIRLSSIAVPLGRGIAGIKIKVGHPDRDFDTPIATGEMSTNVAAHAELVLAGVDGRR